MTLNTRNEKYEKQKLRERKKIFVKKNENEDEEFFLQNYVFKELRQPR